MTKALDNLMDAQSHYCLDSVDSGYVNRRAERLAGEKQLTMTINDDERPFRIYWRNGTTEVIHGTSITNAFNKKFGGGAVNAVDWYDTTDKITHKWDKEKQRWDRIDPSFDVT